MAGVFFCAFAQVVLPLFAPPSTHPRAYRYQCQRPGSDWLPDAVTDTTAKRKRGARRLLGDGEGILCRLWALGGQLVHLVVPLPRQIDFYWEAPALARLELQRLLDAAPRYCKVALSRSARPHVHVLAVIPEGSTPPVRGTYGEVYAVPINTAEQLERLAGYFSRPNDERACRPQPKHLGRFTADELRTQQLDAAELYLSSLRWDGRPERRSWTTHLPRLKPHPHAGRCPRFRRPVKQRHNLMLTCRILWQVIGHHPLLAVIKTLRPERCARGPPQGAGATWSGIITYPGHPSFISEDAPLPPTDPDEVARGTNMLSC